MTFFEIVKDVLLYTLLWLSSEWSIAIGGLVFAVTMGLARLRPVDFTLDLLNIILSARLHVIAKFLAWAISSSGLVFGYYVYVEVFGELKGTVQYAICFVLSGGHLTYCIFDMLVSQQMPDLFIEKQKKGLALVRRFLDEEAYGFALVYPQFQFRSFFIDRAVRYTQACDDIFSILLFVGQTRHYGSYIVE